ncbi:hypothetical protein K431DRAFT_290382 [Polychaeton citri CBS 116435]|uniref:Uncharacterized protein n=1 Tax=Polychaeton citri CBS 116435 TaxID=1314669 RepID=A0A9P4QJH0_9PEZI|nr:hypothetical protein K431DRAFT_290382 [Polychaeton citri CBS 116435]
MQTIRCLSALIAVLSHINLSYAQTRCRTQYGQYPTTSLRTSTRFFGPVSTAYSTTTSTTYTEITTAPWTTITVTVHTTVVRPPFSTLYSETLLFLYTSTTTETTTVTPPPTPTPNALRDREANDDILNVRARSGYPTLVICTQRGGTSISTVTATSTSTYYAGGDVTSYYYDVATLPSTRTLGIDYSTVVTATTTVTA